MEMTSCRKLGVEYLKRKGTHVKDRARRCAVKPYVTALRGASRGAGRGGEVPMSSSHLKTVVVLCELRHSPRAPRRGSLGEASDYAPKAEIRDDRLALQRRARERRGVLSA